VSTEQEHIEKLKKGSYKDFTSLYNLYASRLYAFALTLSHSETASKDIVQETFIKVWINREQIDPDKSFRSYLFTIARNQIISEFRSQVNQPKFVSELESLCSLSKLDPEEGLILEEFNQALEEAKKKLSPRQREFFELNKEQGIPVSEIASMISVSEQSVRNQLSHAMSRLREELQKHSYLLSIFFL